MLNNFLGIDLGTTTLKICLIDEQRKSECPNATLTTEQPKWHEQDPLKFLKCMMEMLKNMDLRNVKAIAISGQMHGLIMWNQESVTDATKNQNLNFDCSNLITWMDHRCDPEFLYMIATGFGAVTLAWLQKHNKIKSSWNRAGTLMDFVNAVLASDPLAKGFISTQNAHGWAYRSGTDWTIKDQNDIFPVHLLPTIVEMSTSVGSTKNTKQFSLPENVKLLSTMGDVQASLLPVIKRGEADETRVKIPSLTKIPYFGVSDNESLIVSVGMNGGNIFDSVARWANFLFDLPLESMKLKEGVLENTFKKSTSSDLVINPVFYAERHNPKKSGATISAWTPNNSGADFLQALAKGIICILSEMMPEDLLIKCGINEIRLVNRACQPVFEEAAQKAFPRMKIRLDKSNDLSAAFGAACFAKNCWDNL